MSTVLPHGWVEAPISALISPHGEMCDGDWVESKDQDARGTVRLIQLADIGDGSFVDKSDRYLTIEKARELNCTFLKPGDVLISRLGEPLGKACIFPTINQPCVTVVDVHIFRAGNSDVSHAWLVHWLNSPHIRREVDAQSSGTTRKRITGQRLRDLTIPIPPSRAQQRIASRIDELFSRINEGKRALERVQRLVERYRQSVLKAAVTGELTREWREQRKGQLESGEVLLERILKGRREAWEKAELCRMKAKGIKPANDKWKQKYQEPPQPDTSELPELPEGWVWASVEQAGEVRLGRQRAPQHHFGEHMRPYLRVANVYEDRLDLSDVMQMNFTPDEFKTYELHRGDILLNEGQSPELVGRPAMYRGEIAGCCYQKTLLRFRSRGGVRPDFALFVFRSHLHSGRFRRSANITTSIAHLAAERFVVIEFPVPPEEEQAEIVERATRKLSVVSHLELELEIIRKTVPTLRNSVLNAAFSGSLLAQDLSDEPATILLDRIRKRSACIEPALNRGRRSKKKLTA